MKKIILFMLLIILVFFTLGCRQQVTKLNINNADDITIFYGVSSYAMFGAEQSVIDDLVKKFDKLTFTKTDDKIHFVATLMISFIADGKIIKKIDVDKNGTFMLNGEKPYYKESKGSFDYEYVKNIYLNSQKN
jgi:hypothetical protein